MNDSGETIYVDIRAKAKPERTPEWTKGALAQTGELMEKHGHKANIRLEYYEPSLQHAW
eukprot:CAMPEP_0197850216 /NCGR_PEP_ID=MMETSP1438-20131217/14660_1 /TAXON_ID=1461541 /ORGANISM="Pterosperma sp., Strain CCMP1384" /LENGTH=58 /DNA_ID=CAMNT_0043463259 /DNA_START=301 /DNA_END=474 /DNA_ORIENTATION=-